MKPIETVKNNAECERILTNSYTGMLVMCQNDNPYAVPINHTYFDGKLYFHCAPTGLKLDMIRDNPNVCYVVSEFFGDPNKYIKGPKCHGEWESVIVYGKARVVSDPAELCKAFSIFMKHYGSENYTPSEKSLKTTNAIIIEVKSMTARREIPEREKRRIDYWSWSPIV